MYAKTTLLKSQVKIFTHPRTCPRPCPHPCPLPADFTPVHLCACWLLHAIITAFNSIVPSSRLTSQAHRLLKGRPACTAGLQLGSEK